MSMIPYIPNDPTTHPAKDAWLEVMMLGEKNHRYIKFDPSWGKDGGWFTSRGHAVTIARVFSWKKVSGFMLRALEPGRTTCSER